MELVTLSNKTTISYTFETTASSTRWIGGGWLNPRAHLDIAAEKMKKNLFTAPAGNLNSVFEPIVWSLY